MVEPSFRTLSPDAEQSEIAAVAGLLSDAFTADPYFAAILGSGPAAAERSRRLFALQLRHQYLPHGVVDVAELDGRVAGVGLWAPPGSSAGSLRSQARLLPGYLRLVGRRLPRAARAEIAGSRFHPEFPHWYLYMLGAHPDFAGRGVGGRLLEYRTAKLGTDPAYLEASSPASARLYLRHGFVELGEIKLPGRLAPLVGMWRPGRAT